MAKMRRLSSRRQIRWGFLALLAILCASPLWVLLADTVALQRPLASDQALAREVLPRADRAIPRARGPQGSTVQSEALARIGITEYHAHGYTGRGVKVAVIDEHFDGYADGIRDGELPADLVTRRFAADGSSTSGLTGRASLAGGASDEDHTHGVACAEIVHDVAPSADLYLIQVEDLRGSLDDVFDYVYTAGVQVVSLSLSVSDESRGDGRGVLAESRTPIYDVLDDAREKGILIVKSAGNDATQHYRGAFQDSDQDGWHEFSRSWLRGVDEDLDVSVAKDAEAEITLSWDDWGDDPMEPASITNYDLLLYDAGGRVAAESARVQAGGQPPVESLTFTPSEDGDYHIRVRGPDRPAGAPPSAHQLSLRIRGEGVVLTEHRVPRSSLGVPADSGSVIAVAAADVATGRLASYSSRGPTVDGRVKPDATSYTNVSVSAPRVAGQETSHNRRFSGTSAAAPHVAGMAALLWSMPENRHRDVEAITERLLGFAADKGAPGKDNAWGVGILQLPPLAPRLEIHTDPALRAHPEDARLVYAPVSVNRADGSPIAGLTSDAFAVDIGGTPTTLLSVRELAPPAHYVLELEAPRHLPQGRYDLTVTALGAETSVLQRLARQDDSAADAGRSASAASTATLDVIVVPTAPRLGEAVTVLGSFPRAFLEQGWVRGEVRRPDGETDPIVLHDDGMHGDGVAEDGVYGGEYGRTTVAGRYRAVITATASLHEGDAAVERRARITFRVRDALLDDDQDGLPDRWEQAVGLNPAVKDAQKDSDHDGLRNLEEYRHGAHPLRWDTDGDSLSDGSEVHGHFATSPATTDTDLGGVDDGEELRRATNPLEPADDGQGHRAYMPLTYRAHIPDFNPAHHAVTADVVWLATAHGLVRWSRADGRYVKITTHDGLANDVVQAVAVEGRAHDGRVWAGTRGGVGVFDGTHWSSYTSADGLAHDRVRDIAIDASGDVWFATARGVSRFDGSTWTTYTSADGLIDGDVYAVAAPTGEGRLWVGTRHGLSAFDGHAWCDYATADGLPNPWVTDIAIDAQGQPWFGTWGGGLSYLTSSGVVRPITPTLMGDQPGTYGPTDGSAYVSAIVEDSDEHLWIHTALGVSTREGETWATYVSDDYLGQQTQFDVPISEAVHRWFGTRPMAELPPHIHVTATAQKRPWYGVQDVTETEVGTWITYADGDDSAPAPVHAIAQDADDQIWIGTADRLLIFTGEPGTSDIAWRDETARAGLVDRRVSDIVVDDLGRLWLGIDGQGVVQFDGQRWRSVKAGTSQSSLHVSALAVDGYERLWVGSAGGYVGLSVLHLGKEAGARSLWTNLRPADDAARQPVHDLAIDSQDRLWAATESGVFSLNGGTWTHHQVTAGAARALTIGPQGRVWAGTAGAVSSYDGDRWQTYRLPGDLAEHQVTALTVDSKGRAWAGTSGGAAVLDGTLWQTYTTADGLASNQIWAMMADDRERMWFGSEAGVTVHIPREIGD
jgi:ligand-binding sensor domain-containing protein